MARASLKGGSEITPPKVGLVFGPLNGVRVALVSSAVVAALAALLVGYPFVAVVLLAGVAIHGLGWIYLYRQRFNKTESFDPRRR